MIDSTVAMAFGLSPSQFSTLKGYTDMIPCELVHIDTIDELIEARCFFTLIVPSAIHAKTENLVLRYFEEVDGNLKTIVMIEQRRSTLATVAHAKVFASFDAFLNQAASILSSAYKKAKESENTIKNFTFPIILLNHLTKVQSASSYELSALIQRDEPTVRRYMEVLRVSGKPITYDWDTRQWALSGQHSVLLS